MGKFNFKNEIDFKTTKAKAEEFYATIGAVDCPYFGGKVAFNVKGIKHLKFKSDEVKDMGVDTPTDELAVKLFILKTRSINPATEIKTELKEIEKEIWYQGEKTKSLPDRNKIAIEWCKLHAPGWRDNWVFAALYVFEHDKPYYLKLLEQ